MFTQWNSFVVTEKLPKTMAKKGFLVPSCGSHVLDGVTTCFYNQKGKSERGRRERREGGREERQGDREDEMRG
jgi:hypothetical protein